MPTTTEKDMFENTFRRRLANGDQHAIFSSGCCYHFALKIHEIYGYPLFYEQSTSSDQPFDPACPAIGHCWAQHENGKAIDINGMMDLEHLPYFEKRRPNAAPIEPPTLRASLSKRGIPDLINDEIFALAEGIIRTHERYDGVRPVAQICEKLFSQAEGSNRKEELESQSSEFPL